MILTTISAIAGISAACAYINQTITRTSPLLTTLEKLTMQAWINQSDAEQALLMRDLLITPEVQRALLNQHTTAPFIEFFSKDDPIDEKIPKLIKIYIDASNRQQAEQKASVISACAPAVYFMLDHLFSATNNYTKDHLITAIMASTSPDVLMGYLDRKGHHIAEQHAEFIQAHIHKMRQNSAEQSPRTVTASRESRLKVSQINSQEHIHKMSATRMSTEEKSRAPDQTHQEKNRRPKAPPSPAE